MAIEMSLCHGVEICDEIAKWLVEVDGEMVHVKSIVKDVANILK